MKDIQRYNFCYDTIVDNDCGEWVRYNDVKHLINAPKNTTPNSEYKSVSTPQSCPSCKSELLIIFVSGKYFRAYQCAACKHEWA